MTDPTTDHPAARTIRARTPLRPEIGLVLGSGLDGLVSAIDDALTIDYRDLEGFPRPSVSGHRGHLIIGTLGGRAVAAMAGRAHYYEDGRADAMRRPIETLKEIGCHTLILTNSAGSLVEAMPTGSVMMITDHLNLAGANPLIGETSEARFVGMNAAYDPAIRDAARRAATETKIALAEGIYAWFSGPTFETPAEIRMARTLGADAVGMSTVPEVILARFLGLRVCAFSAITNMGAGLDDREPSHDETKANAPKAGALLSNLLPALLARL